MTATFRVLAFAFLVTLLSVSATFAGVSAEQSLPTPDMGRAYHFFNYLANGVPAAGYNSSPYLPKGMDGIGQDAAMKIWNEARKEYSDTDVNIFASATLQAASKLYGNTSTTYTAVQNAWTALNVTTAAGITVTSPAGGENWVLGSRHTIRWTYTGNPGSTVTIYLWTGLFNVTQIAQTSVGTSGAGSYVWSVPCAQEPGIYKIWIVSDIGLQAFSNSFNTVLQTITITTPGAGANWRRGTTHAIKWTYTGGIGATVNITLLSFTGPLGLPVVYNIKTGAPAGTGGAGSYSWAIPTSTPVGSAAIEIAASCGPASGVAGYMTPKFNITP